MGRRSRVLTLVVLILLATALSLPARAIGGDIELFSVGYTLEKANGASTLPSISSVGRVAFESVATNIHPDDTDVTKDVFVTAAGGTVFLVSSDSSDFKQEGVSSRPSINTFGNKVAFQSTAPLGFGDGDTASDVFVKDLSSRLTTLASSTDDGEDGNGISERPSISPDGSLVVFESTATNLDPADTDSVRDLYVKNLVTGDVSLISTSDTGAKGNGASDWASITWNSPAESVNATVAFRSAATNLDPADTNSDRDIYVKSLSTGDIRLASTSDAGVKGNQNSVEPSIDHIGRFVAFETASTNLDPAKTDNIQDVFVKDMQTGDLSLVSVSSSEEKGNSHSRSPSISDDGEHVAFYGNATNLDPSYPSPPISVYVRDIGAGETYLVSASDDGVGANFESFEPSISPDGRSIAFDSNATNLDPGDTDFVSDIYVKSVQAGGGTVGEEPSPTAATQTTSLTVPEEPGVLAISLQLQNVELHEIAQGENGETTVGDISYVNTLGTGNIWGSSVAATSMTSSGDAIGFDSMAFYPGETITAAPDATGTLNPGVGERFAGTDTEPGTTFSDPITVMTADGSTQGSFTQANSMLSVDVPVDADGGEYVGTLQYTVIG